MTTFGGLGRAAGDPVSDRGLAIPRRGPATLADPRRPGCLRLDDSRGQESFPLIKDGVMYVTTHNATIAIDAASGKQIWKTAVDYPAETRRRYIDEGFCPEESMLAHALKENNTLVELGVDGFFKGNKRSRIHRALGDALEERNVTLKKVQLGPIWGPSIEKDFGKEGCKLYYYTQLNLFGRAKLQDPHRASFQDLYGGLCRANKEALDSKWKCAILYGLLRMAPSVWSSKVPSCPTSS